MKIARRVSALALAAACLVGTSTPASAALVLGATNCANTNISPTASACSGWYVGNLVSGNATDLADSATAVNALLGTSFTGATLPILETLPSLSGNAINFATLLTGTSVLAVHVGGAVGAGGIGYSGTAFFKVNNGGDILTLNLPGLSNARLFTNGTPSVPEPATWLLMMLGFGGIGLAMRKRNGTSQTRVRFG